MTPIFDNMDKPEAVIAMAQRAVDGADLIDLRRKLTGEVSPEKRAWIRTSIVGAALRRTPPWDAPFPIFND